MSSLTMLEIAAFVRLTAVESAVRSTPGRSKMRRITLALFDLRILSFFSPKVLPKPYPPEDLASYRSFYSPPHINLIINLINKCQYVLKCKLERDVKLGTFDDVAILGRKI